MRATLTIITLVLVIIFFVGRVKKSTQAENSNNNINQFLSNEKVTEAETSVKTIPITAETTHSIDHEPKKTNRLDDQYESTLSDFATNFQDGRIQFGVAWGSMYVDFVRETTESLTHKYRSREYAKKKGIKYLTLLAAQEEEGKDLYNRYTGSAMETAKLMELYNKDEQIIIDARAKVKALGVEHRKFLSNQRKQREAFWGRDLEEMKQFASAFSLRMTEKNPHLPLAIHLKL